MLMNFKGFFADYGWRRRWFYPLMSGFVALSLCLSTFLPAEALDIESLLLHGIQILQISNLSDRQEVSLGRQMNQELLNGNIRLNGNSALRRYVDKIGQRLVANSDRPSLPFTFQVVEDDSINAFATTGGFVYIHTGLIAAASNEAELASVIAHEIGHITGKHLVKQIKQKMIASGVVSAVGLESNQAVAIGLQLALNLPRSRQDEFDADRRGLGALTRSGYAQSGMISFMEKHLKKGGSMPAFLSTHPAVGDRIRALERSISEEPSNQRQGLDNSAYQAYIRSLL